MIQNERLLSTFLEYIVIDSESGDESRFAARVHSDLEALGCHVSFDNSQAQTGCGCGNLFAFLPGNAAGEPIILSAHMDTVTPGKGIVPVIENGVIRSAGETILGGDDKSGIAAIMEALRVIREKSLPHPDIQVVLTVGEESGLLGSKYMEFDRLRAKKAVVLDSSGNAGVIITAAPGQYKIDATVVGRRAHAGVAPEEGISAIQVLAQGIAKMRLLRIDGETTANIGSIHAEYATNIVPERASICAEARSRDNGKLKAQVDHMVGCLEEACEAAGASLECTVSHAYSAYSYDESDPFVRQVVDACGRAGLVHQLKASGGGSDANNFNANGIQALVLGTGMTKVHTTAEELTVENLENTAKLVLELVQA